MWSIIYNYSYIMIPKTILRSSFDNLMQWNWQSFFLLDRPLGGILLQTEPTYKLSDLLHLVKSKFCFLVGLRAQLGHE